MEKYEKMKSFDPEIYVAIQDETNRQKILQMRIMTSFVKI